MLLDLREHRWNSFAGGPDPRVASTPAAYIGVAGTRNVALASRVVRFARTGRVETACASSCRTGRGSGALRQGCEAGDNYCRSDAFRSAGVVDEWHRMMGTEGGVGQAGADSPCCAWRRKLNVGRYPRAKSHARCLHEGDRQGGFHARGCPSCKPARGQRVEVPPIPIPVVGGHFLQSEQLGLFRASASPSAPLGFSRRGGRIVTRESFRLVAASLCPQDGDRPVL